MSKIRAFLAPVTAYVDLTIRQPIQLVKKQSPSKPSKNAEQRKRVVRAPYIVRSMRAQREAISADWSGIPPVTNFRNYYLSTFEQSAWEAQKLARTRRSS